MSRLRIFLLLTTLIPLAAACGPDDVASPGEGTLVTPPPAAPVPPPPPPAGNGTPAAGCPGGTVDRGVIAAAFRNCEISGRIADDYTVQKLPGVIYSLAGPVNVGTDVGGDGGLAGGDAVTLTVQAGVVIFASSGNDYLVVNRGSRINAVGTAAQPVIFTARANVEGTAADSSQGLWGGIILLGRAPMSDCNTAVPGGSANCQQVIEGTTGSFYGGNAASDNSGTMRFVQIRYSGFAIAPGNELQGLTLGGVGSGTTLDHIQVHNSSDDGIEIFGGRANLKHLAVTGADDDSIDTDLGYRGTIQFVIGVQRDGQNGDSMIEADSPGNEDALPRQYTRLANATFVQRSTVQGGNAVLIRGGADYAILNSVITGPTACLDVDATSGSTMRGADAGLQDLGPPVFRSLVLACPTPFREDGNVAAAEIATLFNSGSNNNPSFTPSLINLFMNGTNENSVIAADLAPFNNDAYGPANASAPNRLEGVTYIGAVRNGSDTWFSGWTCNAGYVNFGPASSSCTAIPAG